MTWDVRVVLLEHDPAWAARFDVERARLAAALGPLALAIEHIGSTSVPGLCAKPIIDVLVGVQRVPLPGEAVDAVVALGLEHRGELGIAGRHYFSRADLHVHLVERGSAFFRDHLLFRDVLRAEPATAAEYARLKRELAARLPRADYTPAKAPFIEAALTRARSRAPAPG